MALQGGRGVGGDKKAFKWQISYKFYIYQSKTAKGSTQTNKGFHLDATLKLKSFVFVFPNFSLGYFYVGCYCIFPVALQGNGHNNEVILKLLHDFWIVSIGSIEFVI